MMENFCKLVCGAAVALFGVIVVADLMKPRPTPRARWIVVKDHWRLKCSRCGFYASAYKYCPGCGAVMGDDTDEKNG